MNNVKGFIIGFTFLILFLNPVLADMPAPPAADEMRIVLAQDYPGYQFYLCSFDLEVRPNPNPPHPSRPDMIVGVPGSFKLKPVELSAGKQITEMIGKKRLNYRGSELAPKSYYLAVVKGAQTLELEPKIEETIGGGHDANGIMFVRLEDSMDKWAGKTGGTRIAVNKITLTENGLRVEVSEGQPGTTNTCIGLFMFTFGIMTLIAWRGKMSQI